MSIEEIYRHPDDYDVEMLAHGNDDLPFWLELLTHERPRHVLEVGCGTGRLTIPIARIGSRQGFHTTGVDAEAAMLRRARERAQQEPAPVRAALRLAQGDVRTLHLQERFEAILLPFGVAHHLLTLDEQLAAWRALRRHLILGGLLAVEVTAPKLDLLAQAATQETPRAVDLDMCDASNTHLRRSVAITYCPATQQALLAYSYQVCPAESACHAYDSRFTMHVYFPREFALLFAATGFTVEQFIGSYDGAPFDAHSPLMIGLARAQ